MNAVSNTNLTASAGVVSDVSNKNTTAPGLVTTEDIVTATTIAASLSPDPDRSSTIDSALVAAPRIKTATKAKKQKGKH